MSGFKIDYDKATAVVLYIANKIGEVDFHKLFKILYFAEQEHLSTYGRPIVNDIYIAMQNGPVPSFIYDALKYAKGTGCYNEAYDGIAGSIEIMSSFTFKAKEQADIEELSVSEISCLDKSIIQNKDLSFKNITDKSHDSAWCSAGKDDTIKVINIAKAGGASDEMLKYIKECMESHNIEFAS